MTPFSRDAPYLILMDNHDSNVLFADRQALVDAWQNLYDPDDFPGSRAWYKCHAAEMALAEFDCAHPDIIAAIRAQQKADEEAKYAALSDFVKQGS